jgi:DnaJ-class molecular chaperone
MNTFSVTHLSQPFSPLPFLCSLQACPNGRTQPEKTSLTIDVNKGMRSGERITFEGVADEKIGHNAGDLIFYIQEMEHEHFKVRGSR